MIFIKFEDADSDNGWVGNKRLGSQCDDLSSVLTILTSLK